MRSKTRYGDAKQKWHKGLIPALVAGASTYILYRFANKDGFDCGYMVGTPDDYDVEQWRKRGEPKWN